MALTITLPDEFVERIQRLANKANLDVEDVLNALPILISPALDEFDERPIEQLSDDDIILLANSKMNREQDARLQELNALHGERALTSNELGEKAMLFQIYMAGQMRKAQAMVEARKRGVIDRINHEYLR
jgi:uncharacterized protein YnzC (UPF0291/DUF896 family)